MNSPSEEDKIYGELPPQEPEKRWQWLRSKFAGLLLAAAGIGTLAVGVAESVGPRVEVVKVASEGEPAHNLRIRYSDGLTDEEIKNTYLVLIKKDEDAVRVKIFDSERHKIPKSKLDIVPSPNTTDISFRKRADGCLIIACTNIDEVSKGFAIITINPNGEIVDYASSLEPNQVDSLPLRVKKAIQSGF